MSRHSHGPPLGPRKGARSVRAASWRGRLRRCPALRRANGRRARAPAVPVASGLLLLPRLYHCRYSVAATTWTRRPHFACPATATCAHAQGGHYCCCYAYRLPARCSLASHPPTRGSCPLLTTGDKPLLNCRQVEAGVFLSPLASGKHVNKMCHSLSPVRWRVLRL